MGKLKQLRYQLEWALLKGATTLIPWLPRKLMLELSAALAELGFLLDYRGRQTALENLRVCYPQRSKQQHRQIARQSYRSMSRTMFDLFWMAKHLNQDNYTDYIDVIYQSDAAQNASLNRNALFLTPHYSNFELGATLLGLLGHPCMVVAQDFKNAKLTPLFSQLRESSGHEIVSRDRVMLKLLRRLKQGGNVAFLSDLSVDPKQVAVPIRVFDRWISAPALPAVLATRTNTPLIAGFSVPLADGSYRSTILDPIIPQPEDTLQSLTQRVWDACAQQIQEHPEHWLWAYKHWRYLPEHPEHPYPNYANSSKRFNKLLKKHS